MKKLICFALIALLLSFAVAEASVGYKKDGEPSGNATSVNIESGYSSFDGSTLTIFTNGYADGVTTNVSTESNLTSAALAYGVVELVIGSSKSISLANGTPGQMLTFIVTVAGGGTLTITDDQVASGTMTKTGWDDLAFNAVNDSITLLYYNDTIGWILQGACNSVTVA